MKVDELRELCQHALLDGGTITLNVPGPPPKCGYVMRLFRKSGPHGKIICSRPDGSVVRFKAISILKWLDKNKDKLKHG